MERINQQLARKDQIEAERYQELEKKMRKLQRKYNKVSMSNLHESSQRQRQSLGNDTAMLIEEEEDQEVLMAHEASQQVGLVTTDRRGPKQHCRSLGVPAILHGQQAQSHGLTGRSGGSAELGPTGPAAGLANLDASSN